MEKRLVRTYAIGAEGDLVVKSFDDKGSSSDLSKEYEALPRERKFMREDVYLDVFRYADGDLTWSGSPNGHAAENAISYKLVLDAFTQDLTQEGARSF